MSELAMIPVRPYAFNYGGRKLEDQFEKYRTIKVKGRGSTSVLFETDQVKTGTKIATQKLSANTLNIDYLMYYDEVEEIRSLQRELKHYLYVEEDVPIVFDDDPQIFYYGRLSKFDDDDIVIYSNYFTGAFEIYCQDHLKYSRTKQSGANITVKSPVETTPSRIEVKLSTGSSIKITNKNTGAVISITGAAIYAGNTITFDFAEGVVLVNGVNKTAILDLTSDFENFYIHQGDVLSCSNGTMTVFCREVYL